MTATIHDLAQHRHAREYEQVCELIDLNEMLERSWNEGRAMRLRRRSGALRVEPISVVSRLRPPAAIALRCATVAVYAVCTLYAISLWVAP